jgi:hypothetical protein
LLRIGFFPKREEGRLRIFRFKELRSLAVAKGASRSPSNREARRDVQEGTNGAREAGSADGLALGRRRRRRRARLAGRTAKERRLVGGTRQGHNPVKKCNGDVTPLEKIAYLFRANSSHDSSMRTSASRGMRERPISSNGLALRRPRAPATRAMLRKCLDSSLPPSLNGLTAQ